MNHKRTQRLYREEGLAVRRRRKRRRSLVARLVREPLGAANERWSLDFVSDALKDWRKFRCLTVLDDHSRECLAIHLSRSIPSVDVIAVLERLRADGGLPRVLVTDNGSEFTNRAFDAWAYARGVKLDYIRPSKPIQNCFVECFNGSLRDECLSTHWFGSIEHARTLIEIWREDYNTVRPHSSLDDLTPDKFVIQETTSEEKAFATTKCGDAQE